MLDREPDPEGFEGRCKYCGKHLTELGAYCHVPEFQGGVKIALHFCNEACAKAYASLTNEDREEFEEVFRAGAT